MKITVVPASEDQCVNRGCIKLSEQWLEYSAEFIIIFIEEFIILFLYAGYEPLDWFHIHILKNIALNIPDALLS